MDSAQGILVKTSLVDFPERVSAAFFLKGCNLRCPYCYNIPLVLPQSPDSDDADFVTTGAVIDHLKKRRNVLSGFVISGGEPLCSKHTPSLIREAKALGYKIKLDTNGTFPDQLYSLISDKELCPDYIAMDIKTAPRLYDSLLGPDASEAQGAAVAQKIEKSISILSALPESTYEFRTVLYPPLVSESIIREISEMLPQKASWYFAHFRNKSCLSEKAEQVVPFTAEEEQLLVKAAQATHPAASLR